MPVETSVFEEDGWVTDHFSQTPLMSTYYLAWAICNFTFRETTTKSGVVVSILNLMMFWDNEHSVNEPDFWINNGSFITSSHLM